LAEYLAAGRLATCGLPKAWAGHTSWTVLDTDFQNGRLFLATWLAWQRDAHRPGMLHYVGICKDVPALEKAGGLSDGDDIPQGSEVLAAHCAGLGPGFHRILLNQAHVSLTLCLGDVRTQLGEHVFQADTVFATVPQDKWAIQLLARRCRRGTRFCMHSTAFAEADRVSAAHLSAAMQAAGFELDAPKTGSSALTGTFNPRWDIPTSRNPSRQVVAAPSTCAIIGAGIAGASVAHALARRGWKVNVFDQEVSPANGASGLPVGLAVPHVSADDSPRSRLSRSGIDLLMQHADRLLKRGQDWDHSGVTEIRPNKASLWHAQACWLKPAALVQAWLAHPGISFAGSAKVAVLVRDGDCWQLHDQQGLVLGRSSLVVVANAVDSAALFQHAQDDVRLDADLQDKLTALQAVHGTLSLGTYAEVIEGLPPSPVNGNGCFIPHLPGPRGEQWAAGSTFETDALLAADTRAQHAANMARLRQLVPLGEIDLADTLDRGPVQQWSATRCVTHDRLPLVGPVNTGEAPGPGLWLCIGMGARGLSFSALCAELLAARLGAEPLPIEFSLSRSLDCNRMRRKPASNPIDSPALRPLAAIPSLEAD
jgi:tRNA 5-methylaminomethyl-2-thiouridine biosynthesis bifunctional protein